MKETIKELNEYLKLIEEFSKDSAQDGQALHAYMIHLTNIMSRAGQIMAEYKRLVRRKKEKADGINNIGPALPAGYENAALSDVAYVYDLAERLSRCCVHTCDGLRTVISSLKNERQTMNY